MDTFLMICYVCADFIGKGGELFSVTPRDLGNFIQAPSWIKKTVLFTWLVNDGSIKVALDTKEQKKLENDPLEGVNAEGKDEAKAEEEEPAVAEVAEEEEAPKAAPKKTSSKAKKGEAK